MVTLETIHPNPVSMDSPSSPRISFSAEFLEEKMGFVSIESKSIDEDDEDDDDGVLDLKKSCNAAEFEFLSTNVSLDSMLSADELFCEGKLLPKFWLAEQCDDRPENICLKIESRRGKDDGEKEKEDQRCANANPSWFLDDDPSPRPPKCTVLWKELLRLRKQRASSSSSSSCPSSSMTFLSPSSSSSSSSSSSADMAIKEGKDGGKCVKRVKKGALERTGSGTVRIRPMINVPICTVAKSAGLPPLFPLKKGRVDR